MSCGKGCSSAGLPWLRNCDEPCERFCLCALRTDFRVKPSTFSAAEMAALAGPAAGGDDDDDDISAALALGRCGGGSHGQRQEEEEEEAEAEAGERRGARAPLRPGPPAPPPFGSRAPPSWSSPPANASRPHLRSGGSWSPLRRGLPEARAGAAGGGKKLLTPGAEGGWRGARSLGGGGDGAGVQTPSAPRGSAQPRLPAGRPASASGATSSATRPARSLLSRRCHRGSPPSRCHRHGAHSSLSAPAPHPAGR